MSGNVEGSIQGEVEDEVVSVFTGWFGGVLVGAGGLIGSRKKVKNASQQNKRG